MRKAFLLLIPALWCGSFLVHSKDEAFLEKPFNRQSLLEAVSLLLFGSTAHERHVATPQPATAGGV